MPLQGLIPEGDIYSSVAGHAEVGNSLKQWLNKNSTAQESDRTEKITVAMNTVKIKEVVQGADHYVRLSYVKTMIDKALMKPEWEKDFHVAKKAEKKVIEAMAICAVVAQESFDRSTVSLALRLVTGNVLGEKDFAGLM